MAIPDYQTLMRPVLQAFADGAERVPEILPRLREEFAISDEEAEELIPSGHMTLLANRAHWARTYLSKAGLLTSPRRGRHVITERGRSLLSRHAGPIDNKILTEFDDFQAWRAASTSGEGAAVEAVAVADADETPDALMKRVADEIESALVDDLLASIMTLSPQRFERLIVELLVAMGFGGGQREMGEVLGKSGDGGIDGVINEDALGLDAVYIQAKRYASHVTVGRPDIQRFVGSLTGEGATKGVFVTTSTFSREARAFLERVAQRIVLIDGPRLAQLMIRHDVGVRRRQTYIVRGVDEDYFSTET